MASEDGSETKLGGSLCSSGPEAELASPRPLVGGILSMAPATMHSYIPTPERERPHEGKEGLGKQYVRDSQMR